MSPHLPPSLIVQRSYSPVLLFNKHFVEFATTMDSFSHSVIIGSYVLSFPECECLHVQHFLNFAQMRNVILKS